MTNKKPNAAELEEIVEKKTAAMYENVESVQEELGKIEIEGKSEKNLVKIILTGQHEIKELSISPKLLKEPNKIVEDNVIAAYSDAKFKVEEKVKQKMAELAKELGFYDE